MSAALVGLILALAALAVVWWQYRAEEARADRWEGEAERLGDELELARAVTDVWGGGVA